ncbi:hypothetical protein LPJ61_001033, partial [Coemansia biformis]
NGAPGQSAPVGQGGGAADRVRADPERGQEDGQPAGRDQRGGAGRPDPVDAVGRAEASAGIHSVSVFHIRPSQPAGAGRAGRRRHVRLQRAVPDKLPAVRL